jgi:hypothetical protein
MLTGPSDELLPGGNALRVAGREIGSDGIMRRKANERFHPNPTEAVHDPLLNPGMGILLIQRGANKKRFEDLTPERWFLEEKLSDKIILDIPWSKVEPREGEYRWDHPDWDPVIESWRKAGFRVALQVRGMSSLGTLYDDGTPQWVFDAGARRPSTMTPSSTRPSDTRRAQDDRPIRHPVYWDPIYLEKARRFIAAFGRRYDGSPWLEFVMPGHLGMWGEMHCCMHPGLQVMGSRAGFTVPAYTGAFVTLLDAYRGAFPSTPLVQETGAPSYRHPLGDPSGQQRVHRLRRLERGGPQDERVRHARPEMEGPLLPRLGGRRPMTPITRK